MGGNSGGAGTKVSRIQKSGSRIGSVVGKNRLGGQSDNYINIKPATSDPSGAGYLDAHLGVPGYLTVDTSYLPRSQRGQGYGIGMYIAAMREAKEQGKGFQSDTTVSGQAQAVWKKLAARGVRVDQSGGTFSVSAAEVQRWGTGARPWTRLERRPGSGRRGPRERYETGWE